MTNVTVKKLVDCVISSQVSYKDKGSTTIETTRKSKGVEYAVSAAEALGCPINLGHKIWSILLVTGQQFYHIKNDLKRQSINATL